MTDTKITIVCKEGVFLPCRVNELLICFCATKLSDFLTWPNPEQLFVAQDVIRY